MEKGRLTSIEFGTNAVAEEDRDATTTLLVESDLESFGDGVFARVVKTSKEEDETLLETRGVAFT